MIMAVITTNIFVSILFGLSLEQVWSLINTLQILTMIPLVIDGIPNNAFIFIYFIKSISSFDIVPYDDL